MIIHNLNPLFLEYLLSDLKCEYSATVVDKITDVLTRLDKENIYLTRFLHWSVTLLTICVT